MLSRFMFEEPLPRDRAAVSTPSNTTSWGELERLADMIVTAYGMLARRRVGLSFRPCAESYAALAALDNLGCDAFLMDAELPQEDLRKQSEKLRLGALLVAGGASSVAGFDIQELPGEEPGSGGSTVTILTSGSTGEPKAARHSWEGIARPVRKGAATDPIWFLSYRPNTYAGLQVMMQCFADRGTLALAGRQMDPQSAARFMHTTGVQFVSATPSYWRRLLMFADQDLLRSTPLKQVTLGGEVVDQPLLDRLRHAYPAARIVHIYATTELGRCFAVNDGLAGFPVSYLDSVLPDGTELRIEEGELQVRSPNSMRMYDPLSSHSVPRSDWFPTSDLVAICGDRVHFIGRKSEMINVAGSKVFPVEVERVLWTIPGISDLRVYGKASSIAGELVACEIVPDAGQNVEVLKATVVQTCRAKLASPQQPRLIKFVDKLDLSLAGKMLRNKVS